MGSPIPYGNINTSITLPIGGESELWSSCSSYSWDQSKILHLNLANSGLWNNLEFQSHASKRKIARTCPTISGKIVGRVLRKYVHVIVKDGLAGYLANHQTFPAVAAQGKLNSKVVVLYKRKPEYPVPASHKLLQP